ncbi:hypothetical protein [Saccharicrinis sp. 156]|uniref:hypothetical protein n=1 Tax=Saccharicrinis sp. 156 TaxID=3417574 RepID=UPI003D328817
MNYLKMKFIRALMLMLSFSAFFVKAQEANLTNAIVGEDVVFEEKAGLVAVEAEYFYKQSRTDIRQWYRSSKFEEPKAGRDEDTLHVYGSSKNAYIEILPDTRVTHDDPLVRGENFSDIPGMMATVHYKIKFTNPGRYYVWARAMSTGGEDNGVHVGLNGQWPEHGQRLQWCIGRNRWTWSSKQRTKEVHCGIPYAIYLDIEKPGVHDVQFSMREDGFEFDKFLLTKDKYYKPEGKGPEVLANAMLPAAYASVPAPVIRKNYFQLVAEALPENKSIAAQKFPSVGTDFYTHGKNWMAINPNTHKEATTSTAFNFESGKYDIVFIGVGENDGRSTFQLLVNGKEVGTYHPQPTENMFEEGKDFNALWKNIELKKGDKLTVHAKVGTDGKEFCRARWAGLVFAPVGKGEKIQNFPSTFDPN